ncbi:MAG: hypothetical protein TH68_07430, partial [Candidatus Synechococcus spongiarum 142]
TLSFTTDHWNTAQTVTVAAAEDDNTRSEAVTLTHATTTNGSTYSVSKSLRVRVIDNDTTHLVVSPEALTVAEAGSATYTARLAKEPTDAVSLTVTVEGTGNGVTVDTDSGEAHQATLGFTTSNWQTEQTVTVRAAADENARSETVTLSHSATGGGYGSVNKRLVVTVTDDDTASLVVSPEALTVAEAGSATYTVKLASQPTDGVRVRVRVMGSGVSVDTDGGTDGEQTKLSFSTSNWDRSQTVTVSAAADHNKRSEKVRLSHIAAGGGYDSMVADLVVTVTDDETPDLVIYPEPVKVVEAGSATYTVKLATKPTDGVTVTMRGMDGSGVSVDTDGGVLGEQTTLSFTPGNWNLARTVTVSAAADENASTEEVTLSHIAAGGDYDVVRKDLVVMVTDNDTPSLVVSPAPVTIVEADSATYTVKLATQPTDGVTVTVSGMVSGVSVDTDPGMGGGQT